MSLKFEDNKQEIINVLIEKINNEALPHPAMSVEFAKQFYNTVAVEDLQSWDADDLFAAFKQFWLHLQQRQADQIKINIYSPESAEHGWHSQHTIVEVIMQDMPFLVDSIRMVIERLGMMSHFVIHMGGAAIERNQAGDFVAVFAKSKLKDHPQLAEAPIWFQIDRQTDPVILEALRANLMQTLEDNRVAVHDWMRMRENVRAMIEEIHHSTSSVPADVLHETTEFLTWIEDHHFTFLGMCDYQIDHHGDQLKLEPVPHSGLGILSESHIASRHEVLNTIMPESGKLVSSSGMLIMSKTSWLSTVHRNNYADYIGIKRFNTKGEMVGERRIIGLYTSAAYNTNPRHIPFLRHKVAQVMSNSELNPRSHGGKALLNIIETLPRDDLIQASEDELLNTAMGIFHLQERKKIRLFARTDIYGRFVSCLVYVPRDCYTTELRQAMQSILSQALNSQHITFSTLFTESVLARIHFVIRVNPNQKIVWDVEEVERKLIDAGRSWRDDLYESLFETFQEEQANYLYSLYKNAFPVAYCDSYTPKMATYDITQIQSLIIEKPMLIHFYQDPDKIESHFRLKVFQQDTTIPLSEVLPIVERLGMRAISERPYQLTFEDGRIVWISDFLLVYTQQPNFKIEEVQERFQDAFLKIWLGEAENDDFNQLVLSAGLDWRQVSILRAYAKYFKQICFTFSQDYIESAVVRYPDIMRHCFELFETRFDPERFQGQHSVRLHEIEEKSKLILKELDQVSNLDEDKILRQYVNTINATLRTNFYQHTENGGNKAYLSLKMNCKAVPGLPKPHPLYEIYLYSPRIEGVHLRGGKVARGGLRWSDRREDFRTEVLGLMKAQQVKNAIIVPTGAKGGFYPKRLPFNLGREAVMTEAVASYQLFIQGLLDITDNYQDSQIIKPKEVICYDGDDPYLVVAADKGTATFSDFANEVSQHRHFWLGDAFASGGSQGYDHKKMGITARGAWESVKRHFYEKNIDPALTFFSVVGVGDMSGDVFGNGMLLSDRIKLVGAFNHLHIFIDPNPDPKISFQERERLFQLPRSGWNDYDPDLISKGGGIFERSAKSISLTVEMKQLLGLEKDEVEPNELIRALLTAEIDLLWSAGIGTFVKSKQEVHADVGDKTNDAIRVNAGDLRCKIIGEGGNLGLTQLARVEYDLKGGLVYTDFIDNSAGVSCSDKEVNIKILLDRLVITNALTLDKRNTLLASMTEEVAALVLQDNKTQTRSISLASSHVSAIDLHIRYIHSLEQSGKLDRSLEYIPDDKILIEKKLLGKGLGLPSISVLQSYSKTLLKEQLLSTDVPEEPFLRPILLQAFPEHLQSLYQEQIHQHPLRREIIATKLSNMVVNEMGFAFVFRMQDEIGASVSSIVRAYLVARTVLNLEAIWEHLALLGNQLNAQREKEVLILIMRLVRRTTRWVLRHIPDLTLLDAIARYSEGVQTLKQSLPTVLSFRGKQQYEAFHAQYLSWGIPPDLAHELTGTRPLFSALDIIEAAIQLNRSVHEVAKIYFAVGEQLEISWIRSQVIAHPTDSYWESFSREAIRDDLDSEQRFITENMIQGSFDGEVSCIEAWMIDHKEKVDYWQKILAAFKASNQLNYTMFFVIVKQLKRLAQQVEITA